MSDVETESGDGGSDDVRLLRRSVDPVGQGDASADKGDLGPIGAGSSCGRDAPVTHDEAGEPVHRARWDASPRRPYAVPCPVCAGPKWRGCSFGKIPDPWLDAVCAEYAVPDLTAPERRWESAWDDRGNWR